LDDDREELYFFNSSILIIGFGLVSPANSTIQGLRTQTVSKEFSFTLQAQTSHGIKMTTGGDQVIVDVGTAAAVNADLPYTELVDVNGTAWQTTRFVDHGDGTYEIFVWTTVADTYAIVPTLNGEPVGSANKYAITVLPGATDPSSSAVLQFDSGNYGGGLYAGVEMRVLIGSRDMFGNNQVYRRFLGPDKFVFSINGPGPTASELDNHENGTYTLRWMGTVTGQYVIDLTLQTVAIQKSPARVDMPSAPVFGMASTASGVGLGQGGRLSVQRPTSFNVALRDVFGNRAELVESQLHVFLQGNASATIELEIPADSNALNEERNQFSFEFEPLYGCTRLSWQLDGEALDTAQIGLIEMSTMDPSDPPNTWTPLFSAATLLETDMTCSGGVWLGSEKTLEGCTALCPLQRFVHVGGGDGNCKCVEDTCSVSDTTGGGRIYQALHFSTLAEQTFESRHIAGMRLLLSDAPWPSGTDGKITPSVLTAPATMSLTCFTSVNPSLLLDEADNTSYVITYHATVTGEYKLNVMHGSELISGKDYELQMVPGNFNETSSEVSFRHFGSASNPTVFETTAAAGDETSFVAIIRDSYTNELPGGLLTASLHLAEPEAHMRTSTLTTGGQFEFRATPTIAGVYATTITRMGVVLQSMELTITVIPAGAYAPNCRTQRISGPVGDKWTPGGYLQSWSEITGVVQQLGVGGTDKPVTLGGGLWPFSFQVAVNLFDVYDNPISASLNATGYVCVVRTAERLATEFELKILTNNVPFIIQMSTPQAGAFAVSIELRRPNTNDPYERRVGTPQDSTTNTVHIMYSPFTVDAIAEECDPSMARITSVTGANGRAPVSRNESLASIQARGNQSLQVPAGDNVTLRLYVTDKYGNPCIPDDLIYIVETPESLIKSQQETAEEKAARLSAEEQQRQILIQMGVIDANEDASMFSTSLAPGLKQWKGTTFDRVETGYYVLEDVPSVSGEYIFFVTVDDIVLEREDVNIKPARLDPSKSFVSDMYNGMVNVSAHVVVHAMDVFSNSLGGGSADFCCDVERDTVIPCVVGRKSGCQVQHEEAPVCGKDENTYPSECHAIENCVQIAHTGECDVRTMPTSWPASPYSEDFGGHYSLNLTVERLPDTKFKITFVSTVSGRYEIRPHLLPDTGVSIHVGSFLAGNAVGCGVEIRAASGPSAVSLCPHPPPDILAAGGTQLRDGQCTENLIPVPSTIATRWNREACLAAGGAEWKESPATLWKATKPTRVSLGESRQCAEGMTLMGSGKTLEECANLCPLQRFVHGEPLNWKRDMNWSPGEAENLVHVTGDGSCKCVADGCSEGVPSGHFKGVLVHKSNIGCSELVENNENVLPNAPPIITPSVATIFIYPEAASLAHTVAAGNGLVGGFKGSRAKFTITVMDRFGNVRDLNVEDDVKIFVVDANATSNNGVLAPGSAILPVGMGCGRNTREGNECDETISALEYSFFNKSFLERPPYTENADVARVRDDGLYTSSYSITEAAVFQVNIFINFKRLSNSRCQHTCNPVGVVLTTTLKRPSLLSTADIVDEKFRAGTERSFGIQLRNEMGYDLNFGGYAGALTIDTNGQPLPFDIAVADHTDGTYAVGYKPTVPGHYTIKLILNLTHESLPLTPCIVGSMLAAGRCNPAYVPVCGRNQNTYPNECYALDKCVEVAYQGECDGRIVPIAWLVNPLADFLLTVLPDLADPAACVVALLHPLSKEKIPVEWQGLTKQRDICDQPDPDFNIHRCPGQTFTFTLDALDKYRNAVLYLPAEEDYDFRIDRKGSISSPMPVNLTDFRNGSYIFAAILTISGTYEVTVTLNEHHIGYFNTRADYVKLSPFALDVDYPHEWIATTSFARTTISTMVAGETNDFFLHPRDKFNNVLHHEPYPGPLNDATVKLVFEPPSTHTKSVGRWDPSNHTILVSFSARQSSEYTIGVDFNSHPFANNQVSIRVLAARAAASKCTSYGPGLESGVAGQKAPRVIYITARDQYGNEADTVEPVENFRVVISHVDERAFHFWGQEMRDNFGIFVPVHAFEMYIAELTDYAAPTYTFEYQPLAAGIYTTSITLGALADRVFLNQFELILSSPPTIQSCRLSTTAVNIELQFNVPTNNGRAPHSSDCADIFDSTSIDQFGAGATCSWLDKTSIFVTLGVAATVNVGGTVYIRSYTVLNEDENSRAVDDTEVLMAPAVALPPTVILAAPKIIGQCDELYLDASASFGSGGRTMEYSWSVEATVETLAAVYDHLHSIKSSVARISKDLLDPGHTYKFLVTVTNFWGATESNAVEVFKSIEPTPGITIEGAGYRTVKRSEDLWLRSQVKVSECLQGDQQMDFLWSVLPGSPPVQLDTTAVSKRDLVISQGSLEAGQTYHFNFRGAVRSHPSLYSDATVQLQVELASFHAAIVGGNRRVPVPSGAGSFTIQTVVVDPEDMERIQTVSYSWSCVKRLTGAECGSSIEYRNLMAMADSELKFDHATALFPGEYTFFVTATKNPGFRSASATVNIVVVAHPILDVSIERLSPTGICSTHHKLVLRRSVAGTAQERFSCLWNADNFIDLDDPATTSTSRHGDVLVIRPGVLIGAQRYSFTLNCSTPSGRIGNATHPLVVNAAPASGTVFLDGYAVGSEKLGEGIQVLTPLEINAANWVDDGSHRPFIYEFLYVDPFDAGKEHVLGSSSSNMIKAILPSGDPDNSFKITAVVYITDRYGARARIESELSMFPLDFLSVDDAVNQASDLYNSTLSTALKTGDVRKVLQCSVILSDMLQTASKMRRRMSETSSNATIMTETLVKLVVESIRDTTTAVPLDAALISQFLTAINSVTANTAALSTESQDVVLQLVVSLLLTSIALDDSISATTAEVAASILQNTVVAGANADAEATALRATAERLALATNDLLVLLGRSRLINAECGEAALSTTILRFGVSAARFCRATVIPEFMFSHSETSSVKVALPDSTIANTLQAIDAVLSVVYANLYEWSVVTPPGQLYNLSSPVVSLYTYDTSGTEVFLFDQANAEIVVPRGDWAWNSEQATTLCGYFDTVSMMWELCGVLAADEFSTLCQCPSVKAVATLQNSSQCIHHTDCFGCLADDRCGWCPDSGKCFGGNSAAPFYPGTCGDAWSYDSCPCESFRNCGDCMLDSDPYSGKPKRDCGYCPATSTCLPKGETSSCRQWNINFVTGTPDNCPQNCSVSWGVANGYSIPGCENGQCVNYVNCVCDSGYYSAACSRMCPGGAQNPCLGNGECMDGSTGSGKCICNPGFGGTDCQDCDDGHWGPSCANECVGGGGNPCHGKGACSSGQAGTGICTCFKGYFGLECNGVCPGGQTLPGMAGLSSVCSGHGTCSDSRIGTGLCTCKAGYWGQDCAGQCPKGSAGKVCSGVGACNDGRNGNGACQCNPTYFGSACESRCPGTIEVIRTLGENVTMPCSGHGLCDDGQAGTGRCRCTAGYRGRLCSDVPIRVRLELTLDISWAEWQLYNLSAPWMLRQALADVLGVGRAALVPITIYPSADVVAFFEVFSVGFSTATEAAKRLDDFEPEELTVALALAVVSWQTFTHEGDHWGCVTAEDPYARCSDHGACDNKTGTCFCGQNWAGAGCRDMVSISSRPDFMDRVDDSSQVGLILAIIGAVLTIGMALLAAIYYGRRAAATRAHKLTQLQPPSQEIIDAKNWLRMRRMAGGMAAANVFARSSATSYGTRATSGASARSVWDIAQRVPTPEDPEGAGPLSVGGTWFSPFPAP
jgi:hypothetical protein